MKSIFIPAILMVFSIPSLFISEAFAYIDPGSGTIIIQAIVGVLVGVGITVKIYWERLKVKFSALKKND